MLTAQMDIEDVMREIMTDVRWLENYQTMQAKTIAKELLRMGTVPATLVKQLRSPKTQNEWTILYTIRRGEVTRDWLLSTYYNYGRPSWRSFLGNYTQEIKLKDTI